MSEDLESKVEQKEAELNLLFVKLVRLAIRSQVEKHSFIATFGYGHNWRDQSCLIPEVSEEFCLQVRTVKMPERAAALEVEFYVRGALRDKFVENNVYPIIVANFDADNGEDFVAFGDGEFIEKYIRYARTYCVYGATEDEYVRLDKFYNAISKYLTFKVIANS